VHPDVEGARCTQAQHADTLRDRSHATACPGFQMEGRSCAASARPEAHAGGAATGAGRVGGAGRADLHHSACVRVVRVRLRALACVVCARGCGCVGGEGACMCVHACV